MEVHLKPTTDSDLFTRANSVRKYLELLRTSHSLEANFPDARRYSDMLSTIDLDNLPELDAFDLELINMLSLLVES